MIIETNNAFTKILETMNNRPINLKNKMMIDLKLKKFGANRLKE